MRPTPGVIAAHEPSPAGEVPSLSPSTPRARATTSSTRERIPNPARVWPTWDSTVRREITSCSAISGLERPPATYPATFRSVGVSASHPVVARRGWPDAFDSRVAERGRWHVAFGVEVTRPEHRPASRPVVGVDVGVKSLAVLSTGDVVENPKHLSKYQRRMARLQAQCARRAGPAKRRGTLQTLGLLVSSPTRPSGTAPVWSWPTVGIPPPKPALGAKQ